ncbi:MAG: hypothetical protein JSR55_05395 [Proteobacteria bacterium]|nr:hypothetical protein [Pseudomonadota bacterium]
MSENVKTTAPMPAAPQDVEMRDSKGGKIDKQPRRKGGGQPGNRNAWKTGLHAKEPRALRKQIARWKRETRALLWRVEKEFSL